MSWINKWEISIIELENDIGKKYKVTRRMIEMGVSESKCFRNKKDAEKQIKRWLE